MPAGQAVSRFGSAIFFFFYTACPQGRPCLGLGWVSFLHGMPAGHAVSRFGTAIFFFFFFYTGCPKGRPCLGLGRLSFFFFFFLRRSHKSAH